MRICCCAHTHLALLQSVALYTNFPCLACFRLNYHHIIIQHGSTALFLTLIVTCGHLQFEASLIICIADFCRS